MEQLYLKKKDCGFTEQTIFFSTNLRKTIVFILNERFYWTNDFTEQIFYWTIVDWENEQNR